MAPNRRFEIQATTLGMPLAKFKVESNASGTIFLSEPVPPNSRLRVRPVM
jgi:hypothetical protein